MYATIILFGVVVLGLVVSIVAWISLRPRKGLREPVDTILSHPKSQSFHYDDLDEAGPSPELLARMEAAGMNTTHERWEDSDAAKRQTKLRRRQIQESMGEIPGEEEDEDHN